MAPYEELMAMLKESKAGTPLFYITSTMKDAHDAIAGFAKVNVNLLHEFVITPAGNLAKYNRKEHLQVCL